MALPHLLVRRYERCLLLSAKRQTDSAVANLWHESTRIIRAPWVHPTSGTVDLHAMTEALLAATFERALPQSSLRACDSHAEANHPCIVHGVQAERKSSSGGTRCLVQRL